MRGAVFLFIFCLSSFAIRAQDSASAPVPARKTKILSCITNLPKDYSGFYHSEFRKMKIKKYVSIAVLTGILYYSDQDILEEAQRFGSRMHISGDDRMLSLFSVTIKTRSKDIDFPLRVPADFNSGMYFIGDGVTHFAISIGFCTYGALAKNERAVRTGVQVTESLFASGIATQFLKHITGRESPFTTHVKRGVWRFFPNQKDYANRVPHYDAFPTGHLATAVGTVTVIAENYPEWRMVRPIGYTLCGLLGFAMLNNGVHWASDYPLGIALGYTFAKVVTARNNDGSKASNSFNDSKKRNKGKPVIVPAVFGRANCGLAAYWSY